jgi:hypothetical protein
MWDFSQWLAEFDVNNNVLQAISKWLLLDESPGETSV